MHVFKNFLLLQVGVLAAMSAVSLMEESSESQSPGKLRGLMRRWVNINFTDVNDKSTCTRWVYATTTTRCVFFNGKSGPGNGYRGAVLYHLGMPHLRADGSEVC